MSKSPFEAVDVSFADDLQIIDPLWLALWRMLESMKHYEPFLKRFFEEAADTPTFEDVFAKYGIQHAISKSSRSLDDEATVRRLLSDAMKEARSGMIPRDIFSGSICVLFNSVLRNVWSVAGKNQSDWEKSGPFVGGTAITIGRAVESAGNNFRHGEEWARTSPPTEQQIASIRPLSEIMGVTLNADGSNHPFGGALVCWAVLEKIAAGNGYDALQVEVTKFGINLLAAAKNRRT